MEFSGLTPSVPLLLGGVLLDAIFGDPRYALHPIRLLGRTLTAYENLLRRLGWNGSGGGCVLFLLLSLTWVIVPSALLLRLYSWNRLAGATVHILLIYSLLALRDLVDHIRAVQRAAARDDLKATREAIGLIVGRDTTMMDVNACRRAAIESLSENFVDGFLSAVFWYVLLGLPGLLLFKVVSTMDSMVGYKTELYLRFGWCGARLDDLMNYIPARLAWLVLGFSALPFPGLSATKAWRVGLQQHSEIPGPNPGWSEATMAGLLQRKLIGPIWKSGAKVTEIWIGDPDDPEGGSRTDLIRAIQVTIAASCWIVCAGMAALFLI